MTDVDEETIKRVAREAVAKMYERLAYGGPATAALIRVGTAPMPYSAEVGFAIEGARAMAARLAKPAPEVAELVERARAEADAMFAAAGGEETPGSLHARNWADKPHRVVYDAVALVQECAATRTRLSAEVERLRGEVEREKLRADAEGAEVDLLTHQREEFRRDYTAEKDRAEAAEAEAKRLREALDRLVTLNDEHSPFGGEMYQDRVERAWESARAALRKEAGHE